jgi:hypothetical protein
VETTVVVRGRQRIASKGIELAVSGEHVDLVAAIAEAISLPRSPMGKQSPPGDMTRTLNEEVYRCLVTSWNSISTYPMWQHKNCI